NEKSSSFTQLDSLNYNYGVNSIELVGNRELRSTYVLTFNESQNIPVLVKEYMQTGLFEYVEPNYIGYGGGQTEVQSTFPNEPLFPRQYGLYNDGTFPNSPAKPDADIDMELAWDIEKGDSSIIVAVLDAGAKLDHPEFAGRMWRNKKETINGIDDDNNGLIDDVQGWDYANNDNDPTDDHGHGTNVSGIIVANPDNGIGYAGVDWKCKLMVCKILNNKNSGSFVWFANAIYYAVDNGARVINMSVGGASMSQTLKDAVDYAYSKGVIIVACMMNENNSVTYYPAGFDHTIAVGSTNPNDERSNPFFWSPNSGSNYGNHIDVVAPGNYIYGLSYSSNTNYNSYWGGTSQATPLVTGLCALLLAQNPNRTPDEVRSIIRETAEDQVGKSSEDTPGFDIYYGYGRINAYKALKYSISTVENDLSSGRSIAFPNPTKSILHIECELNIHSLKIIDLLGNIKLEKRDLENLSLKELDISDLRNGIYLLQLYDAKNQLVHSEKIIKE
ncbi:T9SS type A sorting domain-containing protein, partial [bacterium]